MNKRAHPKNDTVVVSSRISKDLNEWVEKKAKELNMTKSEFIAWSLEDIKDEFAITEANADYIETNQYYPLGFYTKFRSR